MHDDISTPVVQRAQRNGPGRETLLEDHRDPGLRTLNTGVSHA